ncbi:MAG: saccharopine dehydrogenase family protein [Candidatus Thorarchaeota archaeon]|jgi:saccharopine dehydrogenase (NAD+, L-lysine-forming)
MARIVVIGGCGTVGSIAVKTLAAYDDFSEIIVADLDYEGAQTCAQEVDEDRCSAILVDATDPSNIKEVIKGADIVLNVCGPFYKLGPIVLKAVIEEGINYVDVCDDFDATKILLEMDDAAKKADIIALTGMGGSPGIANLLAKFCADVMLDEVDAIDILHVHGGDIREGPAVIAHRIHSMLADIPMYLDGKFTTVKYFEESGIALEEDVDYPLVGTYRSYCYPHPETITLPNYIKCKRVTNLGCVIPPEYYGLIRDVVRLGMVSEDPIDVRGQQVIPFNFAISYILEQREKILKETKFGEQRGCLKIRVRGILNEKPHEYDFSLASIGQAMGESTGIPAAIGAILMQRGKITEKGVLPPEGCVVPMDVLLMMKDYLGLKEVTGEGSPLIIESINHEGKVEKIDI